MDAMEAAMRGKVKTTLLAIIRMVWLNDMTVEIATFALKEWDRTWWPSNAEVERIIPGWTESDRHAVRHLRRILFGAN